MQNKLDFLSSKQCMLTKYPFVCEGGTPKDGETTKPDDNQCEDCNAGYELDGDMCTLITYDYTCRHTKRRAIFNRE